MPPRNDLESQTLDCAFCFKDLNFLTLSQREAHYERHFLNDTAQGFSPESMYIQSYHRSSHIVDPQPLSSGSKTPKLPVASGSSKTIYVPSWNTANSGSKVNFWEPRETDYFWRPEQTTSPPKSFTPGKRPFLFSERILMILT